MMRNRCLLPALLFTLLSTSAWAADTDCDGIDDAVDNCVERFNPDQADLDGDLAGDRCDDDKDGDGVVNDNDNCPKADNGAQEDADADGVGDACDLCAEDAGGEIVSRRGCSIDQLCPCDGPADDEAWKSHDQYLRCVKKKARQFRIHGLMTSDQRRATVIEARSNSCGTPAPQEGDNDGDGIVDASDNCPSDANPSQKNADGDSFGDACDTDKDDDGVLNAEDNCPLVANADGQSADADADGRGDACDACADTAGGEVTDRDGCSVDQLCPCNADVDGNAWGSHSRYRRCAYDEIFQLRLLRIIDGDQADAMRTEATENTCGERPPVCE